MTSNLNITILLSGLFNVLLRLEAVLVGDEVDRVDEAVGRRVLVAAGHLDRLVVLADLLQRALLLAGDAVACLEPVQ